MSWFATDDRFWSHRKVMRLRRSEYYAQAVAVWCLSGSWCSGDDSAKHTGHVHFDVIAGLGVRDWELGVKALVEARLFDETADSEVVAFHDWDFWNGPDAKTKRLERRMEADRVRQHKRRSAGLGQGSSRDQSSDQAQTSRDRHVTDGKGEGVGGSTGTSSEGSSSRATRNINDGRDDALRLCEHLAARIVANGSKAPSVTTRWLDAARLLMDSDGRTEDQVHKAIDWCQDDEFWRTNILSMPTLRDKYDQLRLKALADAKKAQSAGPNQKPDPPRPGSGVWDRPIRRDEDDA